MNKKLISILATVALAATFTFQPVNAQGLEKPTKNKADILKEFKNLNKGKEKVHIDNKD